MLFLGDRWIIDGTYRSTLRARLEKADIIIWLDFSTIVQLTGVISRYIKNKGKEKSEIPGCREKIDLNFLLYVLKYNKNKRKFILDNLEGIDKNKVLIFKNRKKLNQWGSTL